MNHNITATILHGSHLYGLNTESSDLDYKSIYIPTHREIILGQYKDSFSLSTGNDSTKNSRDDVDHDVYSIHKFFEMLKKSDMVAFDMIHAPSSMIVQDDVGVFSHIQKNREVFYSKDLKGYIGYIKNQSHLFKQKADRLEFLHEVLDWVNKQSLYDSLHTAICTDIVDGLVPEHKGVGVIQPNGYMLMGKLHQNGITIKQFKERVENEIRKYGKRTQKSLNNDNVDWKGITHALRACIQVNMLVDTGTMTLPLQGSHLYYLRKVKAGEVDYDSCIDVIQASVGDCLSGLEQSTLPDKIDLQKVDDLLYTIITDYHKGA